MPQIPSVIHEDRRLNYFIAKKIFRGKFLAITNDIKPFLNPRQNCMITFESILKLS